MKMIVFCLLTVSAVMWGANAYALTLKSGQVIDGATGQVADAHATEHGQRVIEDKGVLVAGGVVFIGVGDNIIEVPVEELRGKSRDQVVAIIGEAAVSQLEDQHADADALVAEIEAQGGTAVNVVGSTLQEEIDAITGGQYDQIVGGSQAAADALVRDSVSCDEGGCYNDTTHGEIK